MKKKIFIIAGEVSGDVIGSEIMRAASSEANFIGIGGSNMIGQGVKSLFPISDLCVMGIIPVLKKLRTVLSRIRQTADAIIKEKPDIVLTIDSPSFAARVIKKVKRSLRPSDGYQPLFYHVVAPQVWAWGSRRAKKYAKLFDRLFCFFDFEVPYFTKYGLETIVIGHPFYEIIKKAKIKNVKKKNIVMLIPGSRIAEVKKTMPVLRDFTSLNPEHSFAISTTETTKSFIESEIKSWKVNPKICSFENRYEFYSQAKFAIAKSGTVAVELAILHIPTVVFYPTSFIEKIFSKFFLKTKFISLLNIIASREIFPELIGRNAFAKKIYQEVSNMDMKTIISNLKSSDKLWHKNKSPFKIIADNL